MNDRWNDRVWYWITVAAFVGVLAVLFGLFAITVR